MKKLRIFALLLAVIMVVGMMLTGCSKEEANNQPQQTNGTKSGESTTETQKAVKNVKLKFVGWEPDSYMREIIDNFMVLNPNIEVEYEIAVENNSLEAMKKMDLLALSGEKLDILPQPNTAEHVDRASKGMLAELDLLFDAEGTKFDDIYTTGTKVDGKYYSVPVGVKTWMVLINKDHLDEAGLAVPSLDWTWDDYREYAIKMTKGEGADKRYGSYMHTWDKHNRLAAFNVIEDTNFYKDDMTPNFDNEVFGEFLKFRYDLENTDKAQMPFYDAVAKKAAYLDEFFNGRASMIPIGSWVLSSVTDTKKYPHDFVTTFASLPRWKDGPVGRTFSETGFLSINANSKEKEAAFKFIQYASTEGFVYSGSGTLSAAKGADNKARLERVIGKDTSLVDMTSLSNVLDNRIDNAQNKSDEKLKKLENIFKEESEKYLVDGIPLEEAINNMIKRSKRELN